MIKSASFLCRVLLVTLSLCCLAGCSQKPADDTSLSSIKANNPVKSAPVGNLGSPMTKGKG